MVLAYFIVNNFIKTKLERKMFLFKVDFEKTFDNLNWRFLDDTMEQMGFDMTWSKWIYDCISTVRCSILVNENPTKQFKMEKGITQGDHLSLFLFIIVAESLNLALRRVGEK